MLHCLEEQFVTREFFSKGKVKDTTFVQKMYFNGLLGNHQRKMNYVLVVLLHFCVFVSCILFQFLFCDCDILLYHQVEEKFFTVMLLKA